MEIHGFIKTTLLDYPGHLAATVFTGKCNFRCPFCHNKDLVLHPDSLPFLDEEDILKYNIHVLPLQISTSERTYQDDGIDLQTNVIYDLIIKEIPKTSMPNLGRAVNLLEQLISTL